MIVGISYILFRIYFALIHLFRCEGKENIPQGGFLLCANHSNLADPAYIMLGLGRSVPLQFMAKAELFNNKLVSWYIKKLGAFPVRRGETDLAAIRQAMTVLQKGGRLVLFPEGTRNATQGAKAGAGMLALRTGCPVLPVYLTPHKRPFRRAVLTIGKPFYPQKPEGKPTGADYQNAADEIMERIYALEK